LAQQNAGDANGSLPIGTPLSITLTFTTAPTVLYLEDVGVRDQNSTNMVNALNNVGLTIGNTYVPGLNWNVVRVDDDAPAGDVLTTYSLVVVSDSIASGDFGQHSADNVPIIAMETAIFDDGQTDRDLYLSNGQGSNQEQTMKIIDASHPITSIFGTGGLIFNRDESGGMMGRGDGGLSTGSQALAANPGNATQFCLSVVDTGGLLRPGAPVATAPNRRVLYGMNTDGFQEPSIRGAYLWQRTAQWAAGAPVTAGAGDTAGHVWAADNAGDASEISQINFGTVNPFLGDPPSTRSLILLNDGNGPLNFVAQGAETPAGLVFSGPQWSVQSGGAASIAAGSSISLVLQFAPSQSDYVASSGGTPSTGSLTIFTSDPGNPGGVVIEFPSNTVPVELSTFSIE
jgi:hypothetical protein